MFTEKDLQQLKQKNIEIESIEEQLDYFKKGFPYVRLIAPATISNGIIRFSDEEARQLADFYDDVSTSLSLLKFVPASGAATRMFSHLFAFRSDYRQTEEQINRLKNEDDFNSPAFLFKNIEKTAFYSALRTVMQKNNRDIETSLADYDFNTILDFLLFENGLNYANLPKALILFHKYQLVARTAAEEHLVEGFEYCRNNSGKIKIHFTLSPEHIAKFEELFANSKPFYEKQLNVEFDISWSIQKPSTDTIAVDENNQPFRNSDGSLLFRPGGHGALIHNLNDIYSDVVFIKNIDNIVPDRLKSHTTLYKKAIAGQLIKVRNTLFGFLNLLLSDKVVEADLEPMVIFGEKELFHQFGKQFEEMDFQGKKSYLFSLFNRPLRVCGMVKNEGEPGGGPFVVADPQGNLSLQIIESSQIDFKDQEQQQIAKSATHFNPVDLVCSFVDFRGNKFNLSDFVDHSTGFISLKSKDGKPLKAQELPGLWNGAMAYWNTIFVEVPLITFNPVKTVNDLLRKQHL